MSQITIEEQLAVALAYGATSEMAAMGAAQSKAIQLAQTGNNLAAMWASRLVSVGRHLIAYKGAALIAEKSPAPENILRVNRELAGSIELLENQLKHVLKRRHKAKRLSENERIIVVAVAIDEWTADYCRTCSGAGEIPMFTEVEGNQPMQECPTCHGSLRHRYTDKERESALSLKSELLEKPLDMRVSLHLVRAVLTTRAIIKLAARTTIIEYSRLLR